MKRLHHILVICALWTTTLAAVPAPGVHAAVPNQPVTPRSDAAALTWNTFLGATSDDYGYGIAVDGSGNAYVTGDSTAAWQGATAPQRSYSGSSDAFVAKLDAGGNLVWNTFLGASSSDVGYCTTVDGNGNVYVTGYSTAVWQGTTAPQRSYSGSSDAFVAKLDAGGNLLWNTFLGGSGGDVSDGIAVDGNGDVYVMGSSTVSWQGATAPRRAFIGGTGSGDAFVAKLDASGNLAWNTFLGGNGHDVGYGVGVDESGNIYVEGYSQVSWQGTTAPVRAYTGGIYDAFVAKLDAGGNLLWNTFLGGSDFDYGYGLAVDGSGNAYALGRSYAEWQGLTAPVRAYTGVYDVFAAKLDPSGNLVWNTFLGGSSDDLSYGIGVDGSGNTYVTGQSNTTWQGATPPLRAYSGGPEGFAAKLNASGDLVWNTFLGGMDSGDAGFGIGADGNGNVYVAGFSSAAWQGMTPPRRAYSGSSDIFVAQISPSSNNADLSDLVLSHGLLDPAFASTATSYSAAVGHDVTSLTLTPTAADPSAAITVNGTSVASGSASGEIPLGVGNSTITILVTAQDGVTTKTYTVTVTRSDASAITVTNSADSGPGSLRQAIAEIAPGGTINFNNDYTITLASQLVIDKSLTIDGAGHRVSVSGNDAARVFDVTAGTVTLDTLTIRNGVNNPAKPANTGGGGLYTATGTTVTLNNCAVIDNSLTTHTVGGAIVVGGGSTLTMNNCTISGNSAADIGGIFNLGTLHINSSTITKNVAGPGGWVGGIEGSPGSTTVLRNTILAGNTGTTGPDCYAVPGGTIQSEGYNRIGTTVNCGFVPAVSDVTDFPFGNLGLDEFLKDNGGPTFTHALLPGSPAIDAIPAPGCNGAPASDQRGVARPQGSHCDVGAYEYVDTTAPAVTSVARADDDPTSAASVDFIVTFSEPVSGVDIDDFTLTLSDGIRDASITEVNGSEAVYTVTVATGLGSGTLRLDVIDDHSIQDVVGNGLSGGFTAGEFYTIEKTAALPAQPTYLAPPAGYVTNDALLTFSWAAAANAAEYEIVFASDNNFTQNIESYFSADPNFTPDTPLADGKYYWHVRGYNLANEAGSWSAVRSFTVDALGPQIPLLQQPADNTSVRGTPTFRWGAVSEAVSYQFELDNDLDFTSPLVSVEQRTTYRKPAGSLRGVYYWRVRAKDAAGNWSEWSPFFTVTVLSLR